MRIPISNLKSNLTSEACRRRAQVYRAIALLFKICHSSVSCYGAAFVEERKLIATALIVPLFIRQIMAVSCGGSHTVAIDESGRAYSFGQSSNGQLGLTTKTLQSFEPAMIKVSTSAVPKGIFDYRCDTKKNM